jgi:hypothetical protein
MLFLLTTAAGSALWAARLEEIRQAEDRRENENQTYADDPV